MEETKVADQYLYVILLPVGFKSTTYRIHVTHHFFDAIKEELGQLLATELLAYGGGLTVTMLITDKKLDADVIM